MTAPSPTPVAPQLGFQDVLSFIRQSRSRALQAVNTELLDLYWRIGEDISRRIAEDGWGQATVEALAAWIHQQEPGLRGFSSPNLWKMKKLFETYRDHPKLSPLVRVLPWTHNAIILSKCKTIEERVFYLRLTAQERWGRRDLERQIDSGLFEQTVLGRPSLSPALRALQPAAEAFFKDR